MAKKIIFKKSLRPHQYSEKKSTLKRGILFFGFGLLVLGSLIILLFLFNKKKTTAYPPEIAAIYNLAEKIDNFEIINLPKDGTIEVNIRDGLTVNHLMGYDFNGNLPVMGDSHIQYRDILSDEFFPGEAPYVASSIKPFRLTHFHNEFNYAGHHTFKMVDYAATHGFDTIAPYVRKKDEILPVLPENTHTVLTFSFNRNFFKLAGVGHQRYDQLVWTQANLQHLSASYVHAKDNPNDFPLRPKYLMLDIEESVLKPEKLKLQTWYPQEKQQQADFEKRYYDNYALLYIHSVQSFRSKGYENISIYGWYPYGRTWGGLEKIEADPETDSAWRLFGKKIHAAIDIVNNSVYCFYWSPKNVAYVLRNIDLNKTILMDAGSKKPVIPYFWDLLHGGGGGWRWWRGQPLPTEEQRAIIAMSFFTGIDGLSLWNWSGTENPHRIPSLYDIAENQAVDFGFEEYGLDYMVKSSFTAEELEQKEPVNFKRYDVIHITGKGKKAGRVVFQKVLRDQAGNTLESKGIHPSFPYYDADAQVLASHLRTKSEAISATIEGLALVKPFELFLKKGAVKIDLDMKKAFQKALPLARRKKLGDHHLVITYNPKFIHGTPELGKIIMNDFDGKRGLNVIFPADDKVRIFALRNTSVRVPKR